MAPLRRLLFAVISALLAVSALSCLIGPGGCETARCATYAGQTLPNLALNYTLNSTWQSQSVLTLIGWVEGVYNPLLPKPSNADTFAGWKAISRKLPSLNYEKYNPDATYILQNITGVSLQACCDACAVTALCVEYLFTPPAGATTTDNLGFCSLLNGGKSMGNGPYNLTSGVQYGTPGNVGPYAAQNSSKQPTIFLGGGCNPLGGVTDDPHFTGAHGTKYDFNGELNRAFCLITDTDFHINALLKGYKSDITYHATVGADGKAIRSWIREVGFLWKGGHNLKLVARDGKQQERGEGFISGAFLDGAAITIPSQPGQTISDNGMSWTFVGVSMKGPYEIEEYNLVIGSQVDVSISVRVAHPLLQTPESAEVHFNLKFNDLRVTSKVHGVLGQTYRNTPEQLMKAVRYSELSQLLGQPIAADSDSGKGFLEGTVQDYESSGVLVADCKVSAFSASAV